MIDKRLMKELPEAKQYVLKQVGMQCISLVCNIGFVFLLAYFISTVQTTIMSPMMMWQYIGLVIILVIIRSIATKKAVQYSYLASKDVKNQLRSSLYKKLLLLKNDYTTHVSTSELVQLNVEGIDQLETYFGRYLPQFFYSMIAPITLFCILSWMDLRSSLILLLCVPFIPLSIVAIQKIAKKLLAKYWTLYATLGDSFLENLQGLTTLKIYQADEFKNEEMNKEAENFRNITMKVLTMQLNSVSVMDIVAYGGAAGGSIVAIMMYMQGSLSLFGVLCMLLLSAEFFIPLRQLGSYFHIAMNGIAASNKIFRILDIETEDADKGILQKGGVNIDLEHVTFSYQEDREILHDVSMCLRPKEFVAIVGESGSGKSTCAKLIVGLAKKYQGSLRLQQMERSAIADDSFYDHVMYVTHKPTIFKGSVRENLAMAKHNASDEEMIAVLTQVQLYDFIESQQGLDTPLLEQGANFSGGQNQRLSIARALLADREVYIFDEATSNIDVESEEAILEVIQSLVKSKTVIMITHRLKNIIHSDHIYVLQQGRCVEDGSHDTLLHKGGSYANLYKKQVELETFGEEVSYA